VNNPGERKKVRKAVIAAAGFGTRFLPQTKAMPKEMLPVVDKPIIQYVVEEAVASGIEDIIIVTGYTKRNIEDHFDYINADLRSNLKNAGKLELLEETKKISELANFVYIRQKGPYGNGTPILNAKHVIGDEPFAVLWGDQFTWAKKPRLAQCLEVFEKLQSPVLSAVRLSDKADSVRYGIFDVEAAPEEATFKMKSLVEKPEPQDAPSDLLSDGGYILTPDIFDELEQLTPGKGNEIWLADAIERLSKRRQIYVREVQDGAYYDTGNKLEYLKTVVDFGLMHEDLKEDFARFLRDKMA
jgi:UTP--glucose-1-phosphate uridylyltransferase